LIALRLYYGRLGLGWRMYPRVAPGQKVLPPSNCDTPLGATISGNRVVRGCSVRSRWGTHPKVAPGKKTMPPFPNRTELPGAGARRIVDVKKETSQGVKITLDADIFTGKIRVVAIAPDSPALGLLALSDSLLEVNGTKVRSCAQAADLIKRAAHLRLVVAQPKWSSLGLRDTTGTSFAAAGAGMAPCLSEIKSTGRNTLCGKSETASTPHEFSERDSEEPVSTLATSHRKLRPAPEIKSDIAHHPATPPSRRVVQHLREGSLDQSCCENRERFAPSPPIGKRCSLAPPPRHRCAPVVPAASLGGQEPALTLSAAKAATALAVDLSSATGTAASLAAMIEPDALLDPTTPPPSRRVVRRFNASNLDGCCSTDVPTPPICALARPKHRRAPVVRTLAEAVER